MVSTAKRRNPALFIAILLLHLCVLWAIDLPVQDIPKNTRSATHLVFLSTTTPVPPPALQHRATPKPDQNQKPTSATQKPKTSDLIIENKNNSPVANSAPVPVPAPVAAEPITSTNTTPSALPLDRDVKRLTQQLERELRCDKQKEEAAKPPNQIAREYWEKQNHPYKDKWEELAHKIEQAGVPRDPKVETFKAPDGTQITKIGNRCYKSPDPGRTYLHQAEVRQVICTR